MTTVLITRPDLQSRELAMQLESVGIGSINMPLYDFSATTPDIDIKQVFAASTGRKLAVFTSPRAVEFGLEHIPVEIRVGLEFAAVGAATCQQLEQAGLKVDWLPVAGFTSEDLLRVAGLSLAEASSAGQAAGASAGSGVAIVFAAPGGRHVLQTGLQSKGWVVSKALVYRRQDLMPDKQSAAAILEAEDLISIWTSTSALTSAQHHLPANVWASILKAPALVISTRIKHHLLELGASDITLTDGPGNVDLLQSICKFAGIQHSPTG